MSRFASKATISAFVRRLLFEVTANLLEFGGRDVSGVGLCVHGQQHYLTFFRTREIDDPDTPGLPRAGTRPSDLPQSTRPPYHSSRSWVRGKERREFSALFLGPVQRPELLEQRTFDNGEHDATMRLRRRLVKGAFDEAERPRCRLDRVVGRHSMPTHSPISLLRRNMYFVAQRLSSASGPERRDATRLAATDTNRINPTIPRTIPTGIL